MSATFWFMFDCHLFKALSGTPEEMVDTIVDGLRNNPGKYPYSYGMLCPVDLHAGKTKIRTVAPDVHTRSSSEADIASFRERAQAWIDALRNDPEIMAIIANPPSPDSQP